MARSEQPTDGVDPTPTERQLLRALAEIEPASTRDIYQRTLDDETEGRTEIPTTPFVYLSRFRDRGWVEMEPDPDDGRSKLNALTDAGREVLDDA